MPVRWVWLVFLAVLLQRLFTHNPGWPDAPDDVRRVVLLATYLMALLFAWANRHLLGIWVMGLGILLNLTVMVANGGFMPVSPQAIASAGLEERIEGVAIGDPVPGSKDILKQPDDTFLYPLSDVIAIKGPFTNIISIGDIITAFGLALTLGQLIVVPLRSLRTA